MADWPTIPAGYGYPLVDLSTFEFPEAVEQRLNDTFVGASEARRTPQRYGAKGDGVTDDTDALQAFLAVQGDGFIPPGTYLTSEPLIQRDANIEMSPRAVIRATADMDVLWQVGDESTYVAVKKELRGGILDANGKATVGLLLMNFQRFTVDSLQVHKSKSHQIVVGDPATSAAPYEPIFHNVHTWRPSSEDVPASSYGVWVRRATDGEYVTLHIVGSDIGLRVDTGGNRFQMVHPWGYSGKLPTGCFLDTGKANVYVGCVADTPSSYGWRFTNAVGGAMYGCRVFLNSWAPDNTVNGVALDSGATFQSFGTEMTAQAAQRLASNVSGNLSGSVMLHSRLSNVVSVRADSAYIDTSFEGSSATKTTWKNDSSQTVAIVNTNSTTVAMSVFNGRWLSAYSDNGTTPTSRLKGNSGAVQPGTQSGLGAQIFSGSGAPGTITGAQDGDFYLRTGTPDTANQRIYTRVSGSWVGIL